MTGDTCYYVVFRHYYVCRCICGRELLKRSQRSTGDNHTVPVDSHGFVWCPNCSRRLDIKTGPWYKCIGKDYDTGTMPGTWENLIPCNPIKNHDRY